MDYSIVMQIKNKKELEILREGGRILAEVLDLVSKKVALGISTIELDEYAESLILERGGKPSFKNYSEGTATPYPATLCTSINDEIVHGIPSDYILKDGDILGLDIGMVFGGLYTDTAITVPVGNVNDDEQKLINVAKEALSRGIAVIRDKASIGDIGHAIQSYVESQGFGVVRELVGHGVGRGVHEEPEVPNWGERGAGAKLKEGDVIALEPMVIVGSRKIKLADDKWIWKTADGGLSSHFEHTIVVTKNGAEIITKI